MFCIFSPIFTLCIFILDLGFGEFLQIFFFFLNNTHHLGKETQNLNHSKQPVVHTTHSWLSKTDFRQKKKTPTHLCMENFTMRIFDGAYYSIAMILNSVYDCPGLWTSIFMLLKILFSQHFWYTGSNTFSVSFFSPACFGGGLTSTPLLVSHK